jgi:outer membrane protein TolC
MRHTLLLAVLCTTLGSIGYAQQSLSLEDAAAILYSNNNAIKISETGIEIAKTQKQQLNSAWYPFISATGGYLHFSNKISADANMGELADDALQALAQTFPSLEALLQQLLPQLQQALNSLGNITLSFPLLEQDITSIDAIALWPLFTGGKRILAGKIGTSLHRQAQELNTLTTNAQMVLMLNTYYTLKLAREVEQMNTENLQFMEKLLHNAKRLKEEGFINKADYLVIQVARDEAARELNSSTQSIRIASSALSAVLGKEINGEELSGRWFILDSIPDINAIYESILQKNAQLKILEFQEGILENN